MGSTTPTSHARARTMFPRRARTAAAVAVAAWALTACASGGGDAPDPQASYSQDQLIAALNTVEVGDQTLSAQALDQDTAGTQVQELEQVLDQSTIEPPQCKDLVKAALDSSSGHVENLVAATPSEGQFAVTALPLESSDEATKHAQTANQQNDDCQDFSMELMGSKIEATIDPRDIDVDNGSEGSLMEMTMDMGGQSNTMTQASAVVGNTFVVVSGQGATGESESQSADSPDIEAILQESVTKISEQ